MSQGAMLPGKRDRYEWLNSVYSHVCLFGITKTVGKVKRNPAENQIYSIQFYKKYAK